MKPNETEIRICPKCNRPYTGHPALSRSDNETPICPDCGTREALESIGVTIEEQEKILDTIIKSQEMTLCNFLRSQIHKRIGY